MNIPAMTLPASVTLPLHCNGLTLKEPASSPDSLL